MSAFKKSISLLLLSFFCTSFVCHGKLKEEDRVIIVKLLSFARTKLFENVYEPERCTSEFLDVFVLESGQEKPSVNGPFLIIQAVCFGLAAAETTKENLSGLIKLLTLFKDDGFRNGRYIDVGRDYEVGRIAYRSINEARRFTATEVQKRLAARNCPVFVRSLYLFFFLMPYFCEDPVEYSLIFPDYLKTTRDLYQEIELLNKYFFNKSKLLEEPELFAEIFECSEKAWGIISRFASTEETGGPAVQDRSVPVSIPRIQSEVSAYPLTGFSPPAIYTDRTPSRSSSDRSTRGSFGGDCASASQPVSGARSLLSGWFNVGSKQSSRASTPP